MTTIYMDGNVIRTSKTKRALLKNGMPKRVSIIPGYEGRKGYTLVVTWFDHSYAYVDFSTPNISVVYSFIAHMFRVGVADAVHGL